ncbi:MAG: PKD domain-containing protein [Candidatus Bathyarchaeia archaeon]
MRKPLKTSIIALVLLSVCTLLFFPERAYAQPAKIRVFGLVNSPLNMTETELLSMPMVTEVATLVCVMGRPVVTFNWTGVPLFHLLTLAEVRPEATRVIFRASDGFVSNLNITEALKPTTLLAVKANGTLLSQVATVDGIQGGFRIVAPCKWGYKWVAYVEEIEVVGADYNGTKGLYEDFGFSDYADMPNCTLPFLDQPLLVFPQTFGNRTFNIEAFTNSSITALEFNYLSNEVVANITVSEGTAGFINLILPQEMLKGPYAVHLNNVSVAHSLANVTNRVFLYTALPAGASNLRITGTEFFGTLPTIIFEPLSEPIYAGKPIIFNASQSVDDGEIVLFQWDFGDGTNSTGAVVSHTYATEGTYLVKLIVTDNENISNFATFTINVKQEPFDMTQIIKWTAAAAGAVLLFVFLYMIAKRKRNVAES